MVALKNIQLSGDKISCDYYPENNNKKGHIVVDISLAKIVEHTESGFDEGFDDTKYAWHAGCRLLKICNKTPLPKSDIVVWY